jgi:hypothetical protein
MCYEERYFSKWAGRSARKREEPKPTVEQAKRELKPELKPQPERKPVTTPVGEHEVAAG